MAPDTAVRTGAILVPTRQAGVVDAGDMQAAGAGRHPVRLQFVPSDEGRGWTSS
jgi:hypothetical protein